MTRISAKTLASCRSNSRRLFHLLIGIGCFTQTCFADQAINQFELKDLDVEVGQWEFQSQNAIMWGHPKRRFVEEEPGEFEYDDNAIGANRHALEMEYGTTPWMRNRIGLEYERERLDDPPLFSLREEFSPLVLDEIAIEAVVVLLPVEKYGWGLGMLAEYQYLVDDSEADSLVVGPIFQTDIGNLNIVLNPTFVQFFGGEGDDEKLDFAYGAHFLYALSPNWDLGVEIYGTIDRIGSTGTPPEEVLLLGDHDLHRLGPIVYYTYRFGSDEDDDEAEVLNVGVGLFFGVNEATPDYSFKWSVEYEF